MSFGRTRRLSSWEDAKLPSKATYFAFDGSNSDLARQLYLRAEAGGSRKQFTNLELPEAIQKRLDDNDLTWDGLPGIAQHALLWDSGFGVTLDNKVVQIWTLRGHSMTDLAVPLDQFNAVGCTEMNCTQPKSDSGITIQSLSNLYCTGDQMLTAARCVVQDFDESNSLHLAMWMTGGNPEVIPTPQVRKHSWKDDYSKNSYTVIAVHTVGDDDEAAYGECPTEKENGGYGSLVLPCYTDASISGEVREAMETVQGSPWVTRWLREEYSGQSTSTSADDDDGFKLVLLAPIVAGILVVVGLVALFVFVKHKRQRNIEADALEDSLIYLETCRPNTVKEDYPPESDFARDGSTAPTLDDTSSVSHRGIDKTIKLKSSTSSASDFGSGSNSTLQILLKSEFLIGKRLPYDGLSFKKPLSKGACGEVPYHDVLTAEGKKPKPFHILTDVMAGMLRPSFSENCPPRIRRIGVACCQQDPSRRPTAAQVANMLQEAD
ncbi:hypothetical protein PC114_g4805 [Phytophthora cactorum]|nr:hypothetical protein PC114_g4805 [Phytophthora cactorum]